MRKKQNNLLIIMSISIMLPITLNAVILEDCKDRLMDAFTKSCGNDRLKRGVDKFHLNKQDYQKYEMTEFIDDSIEEEQKKPILFIRQDNNKDILTKITNSEENQLVDDVVSDFNQENIQKERRHFSSKSLSSILLQPYDAKSNEVQYKFGIKMAGPVKMTDLVEKNDLKYEMTIEEELYNFLNNFNDRLPRSFTQVERKKILRDFVKTCCYEDNICDRDNIDGLCF